MQQQDVIIKNERGIHLRPASLIVQAAQKYKSDIRIFYNGKEGSAKEGLDLLILSLAHGAKVKVETDGPDEKEALTEIVTLLETEFDFPIRE